ncbi:lysylphosphatidylglycerol synthase domain-containing protein [Frigidibacter sp. MR17.14]|uniref:lysylphosphatidylglycerol synthase domain-containing protein n=1 Tax=Frigidibacter sp. MR17.14 TaxID=3126509 RepID=UPI003012C4AF
MPSIAAILRQRAGQLAARLRGHMPVAVTATLLAVGIYALVHLVRSVGPAEILQEMRALPWKVAATAGALTAVGYLALASYDLFALRAIGRHLPTGLALRAGLLGTALGNTLGLSALSGGAVRYRFYGPRGLGATEVAAVSAYVAMAIGTGLTVIGLIALALHPGALPDYLPWGAGLVGPGAAALAVIVIGVLLFACLRRTSVRLGPARLTMPGLRALGLQGTAALVDVIASAAVLWVLLPSGKPALAAFVAVYAVAMMAGVLSHVPGGVGVFEAVVLASLPVGVPVLTATAALMCFRIIYYLVPFVLALILLGGREIGGGLRRLRRPSAAMGA